MADRGYTLVDFTPPPGLLADCDSVIRFMEYARANFYRIVNDVPAGCEVDLLASGHAHNSGLVPLLGLWAPAASLDDVPNSDRMTAEITEWSSGLSRDEVETIVASTTAPTWEELMHIGVYPFRRDVT